MFFHGSEHKIEKFTDDFVGGREAVDQEGPGIYFTSSWNNARSYGPYVYTVKLKPRKAVSTQDGKRAPLREIEWLMKQAPEWESTAQNWHENPQVGLKMAAKDVIQYNDNPHQQFLQVWIDFFKYHPTEYVRGMTKLGYDIVYITGLQSIIAGEADITHAIVLNPAIIEFVEMEDDRTEEEKAKDALNEVRKFVRKTLNENVSDNLNDNFWKWFSGSKVVDANGNPLPVHHGTGKKFSIFSFKNAPQKIIWFTSNKSSVEAGEVGAAGKGHIMDLYANIKNPAGWEEYEKYGLGQLHDMGYDGAILPDADGTFTGFVFEPSQLKSVRNKGEWNPSQKSIYKEDEKIGELEYKIEHLNHHHGQDDMELGLYKNGEIIGLVQYSLFSGQLLVSDIIVRPEFRRQGYGSKMMKYIKQIHPEYKYTPSLKTDLGAKFIHKDVELGESFPEDYDFSKHSFTSGDCDIYAVSLHRLYGYPLYVVRGWYEDDLGEDNDFNYEDCHIVVKLPNGRYLDSLGEQGSAELKQNARFMNDVQKITIEPIDEETAFNTFSCQNQEPAIKQVMNYIKSKEVIKEETVENVFDPHNYLDDFYAMDFNYEKNEQQAIEIIQKVINQVRSFKYPMTVYRGIDTGPGKDEDYDNSSWSRRKEVAQGFGDKLFTGIIPNESIIDLEQTIRTRVMNPGEDEVYVPNSEGVEIIDELNEEKNQKSEIWYHHTNKKNLDSILKNGLLSGYESTDSKTYGYAKPSVQSYYGNKMPIFLTSNPNMFKGKDDITLAVNISGLKTAADIPTFEDWLYSIEGTWDKKVNGICFDEEFSPEELWDILPSNNCITYKQMVGDKKIISKLSNITQTIAVLQSIPSERISVAPLNEDTTLKEVRNLDGKYAGCHVSDLLRMDMIEEFLNQAKQDPEYNTEEPEYDWLMDPHEGYPQQTYIQNDLANGRIIFWEGWSSYCWEGLYNKPEYKGLSKEKALKKIFRERTPLIAKEFNMTIEDADFFWHDSYDEDSESGYIMKIVFRAQNIMSEKFTIAQNTLEITEPYDKIQKIDIAGRPVYILFGNVDYYQNKQSILAIKRKPSELNLDHKSYQDFLIEFKKRFESIPELSQSNLIVSIETTSPVTKEMAETLGIPFVESGFKKNDPSFKMKDVDLDKRAAISGMFSKGFEIPEGVVICVMDDFITTGTTFKNAFDMLPENIKAVGVCLFKLES